MYYDTLRVRYEDDICFIQIYRPDSNNTINDVLVRELNEVLAYCEDSIKIIVLEGLPDVFCYGADFKQISKEKNYKNTNNPELLYNLLIKLATGPYITISYVRGKVNAGGVGLVAASDIVISDKTAIFSLSELLFGLYPACVLPFLIRRIGYQKANYLTLMTKPVSVEQAYEWGLVDVYSEKSNRLLSSSLSRLSKLSKIGITNYKNYMNKLNNDLFEKKQLAVDANNNMFSNPQILQWISEFVEEGKFPWDKNN